MGRLTRHWSLVVIFVLAALLLAGCPSTETPATEVAVVPTEAEQVQAPAEPTPAPPTNTPAPPTSTPEPPTATPEPPTATPKPPKNGWRRSRLARRGAS